MGTLKRIYGALTGMFKNISGKPKVITYDADELRKGRKQKVRQEKPKRKNYLEHKAHKNENCRYAKTKGFTIH